MSYPAPPPPPEGGQGIKPSEHLHDLVWVRVKRYDPDFAGTYGAKPAIIIDCEVIAGRFDVGKRFTDSLHTNYKLVQQLENHIGSEFFGLFEEMDNNAIYLADWRTAGNPQANEAAIQQWLARRSGGQSQPAQPQYAQPYQQSDPWGTPQPQQQQRFQQNAPRNGQQQPAQQGSFEPPPF